MYLIRKCDICAGAGGARVCRLVRDRGDLFATRWSRLIILKHFSEFYVHICTMYMLYVHIIYVISILCQVFINYVADLAK